MSKIEAKFILERWTSGAALYKEVDRNGKVFPYPNSPGAKVGNIYLRKTAVAEQGEDSQMPKEITVSIEWEGK